MLHLDLSFQIPSLLITFLSVIYITVSVLAQDLFVFSVIHVYTGPNLYFKPPFSCTFLDISLIRHFLLLPSLLKNFSLLLCDVVPCFDDLSGALILLILGRCDGTTLKGRINKNCLDHNIFSGCKPSRGGSCLSPQR